MSQTLSAQDTSLQKSEGSTKQVSDLVLISNSLVGVFYGTANAVKDSSTTSNTSESYIHSSSIPTIDGVAKGDDDVTTLVCL
jgi:hypothetical protein